MTKRILEEAPATEHETAKKARVQLDFDLEDFQQINAFVKELKVGTRAELFRSAIRVLRWMYLKKQQGCTIVAITRDKVLIEPDFEFFREEPIQIQTRAPYTGGGVQTEQQQSHV